MLALTLVGMSVGMSNVAASIGIGAVGVDRRRRLQIVVSFLLFESAMPLVGLLVGSSVASTFGSAGRWVSGLLLVAVGVTTLHSTLRRPAGESMWERLSLHRIVAMSFLLALDNLVVGFALGAYGVPVVVAALVIGGTSALLSMVTLELGTLLNRSVGRTSELLGAVALIGIGVAVVTKVL